MVHPASGWRLAIATVAWAATALHAPNPAWAQAAEAASGATTTTRFVDAVSGDDRNNGTQTSPWRTLRRAAGAEANGSVALRLRCGSVWREQLHVQQKAAAPITDISAYGNDCADAPPVISGADTFNGQWQRDGNTWWRAVPASLPKVSQLRINGGMLRVAQWPNNASNMNGYLPLDEAHQTHASLLLLRQAEARYLADKDVAGASLMVKSKPWFQDAMQVERLDAATGLVQLRGKTRYPVEAGAGYFLADKPWMLDAPGEFIHDTVKARIAMVLPAHLAKIDPNQAMVEGSVRDMAVLVQRGTGVKLSGITVEMARHTGLRIDQVAAPVVEQVCSRDNGEDGMLLSDSDGGAVRSNSFVGNARTGLEASAAGRLTIADNDVIDTGTGTQHAGWSAGAIVGGDANTISNNRVTRAAYHGIRYAGSGNTRVAENTVIGACARFSDCGALYTWNGPVGKAGESRVLTEVKRNQISDMRANADGAVGEGRDAAAGIYLDDFTRNQLVEANTIVDVPIGVFVHNSSQLQILRNSMVATSKASLLMIGWRKEGSFMDQNRVEGNDMWPVSRLQPATASDSKLPSLAISFHQMNDGMAAIAPGKNEFAGNKINLPKNWRGPISLVKSAASASFINEDQIKPLDQQALVARTDDLARLQLQDKTPLVARTAASELLLRRCEKRRFQ